LDVPAPAYFAAAVQALACAGVLAGYSDGTFRPYAPVSRGQIAKIVSGALALPPAPPPAEATFADVAPDQVFFGAIETAAAAGLVSGYGCGSTPAEPCDPARRPYFRPGAPLTRGQLTKILVQAAGWPHAPGATGFADVPPDSVFAPFTAVLVGRGVISGYTCGGPGEPCDGARRPYFRPTVSCCGARWPRWWWGRVRPPLRGRRPARAAAGPRS